MLGNRRKRSKAEREVIKEQKNTNLIIPRAPFVRIVQEIIQENKKGDDKIIIKKDAVTALQTEAEEMLVTLFSNANKLTSYCNRDTLNVKDMDFVRSISGV